MRKESLEAKCQRLEAELQELVLQHTPVANELQQLRLQVAKLKEEKDAINDFRDQQVAVLLAKNQRLRQALQPFADGNWTRELARTATTVLLSTAMPPEVRLERKEEKAPPLKIAVPVAVVCDPRGSPFKSLPLGTGGRQAPVSYEEEVLDPKAQELQQLIPFLLGKAPYQGVWFGDVPFGEEHGALWWRAHLRRLFPNMPLSGKE